MAVDIEFTEEEMAIDEGLGYPRAYAKLCRDRSFGPYSHGPPFTFTPYALQHHEASRAKDLDEMFPIIDRKAKPTAKPKIFVSLLWKQLNHLGNAGFDPATFRVDPYGNVVYYHADSASPLAWDIDHWFPCSRGGLTVPSNLRILQWQLCKKKHNKLEFLIPWWDLQVGISVNQFLAIFASSNSDFRQRAFHFLFLGGESEELNDSQTVDSHTFPQHFAQLKEQLGLAPAAVVLSRRESYDHSSTLKSLDINRRPRSNSPILAARKIKTSMSKENENPDTVTNPYQAIVMARDSLRQREETSKMQGEILKLDSEVNELRQRAEEEKVAIQDLELVLIKRRRRAEKCRRLAEAQSSYRAMLEKMIRDAMHQSVIYKEQLRLNQAASNALMARLEAQKAICDSSERELHRKFKQRDDLETQVRPQWEQARKRSRMADTEEKPVLFLPGNEPSVRLEKKIMGDASMEEKDEKTILYLPGNDEPRARLEKKITGDASMEKRNEETFLYLPGYDEAKARLEKKLGEAKMEETKLRIPLHKELRVFLEEEQKASEAGLSPREVQEREEIEEGGKEIVATLSKVPSEIYNNKATVVAEDEKSIEDKLQKLKIGEEGEKKIYDIRFPVPRELGEEEEEEEDEESRKRRGKGNVEKWLQMLLEDTHEDIEKNLQNGNENPSRTDDIIRKLNLIYPQKGIKILRFPEWQDAEINKQTVQEKDGGKRQEEIVETEPLKNPPYKLVGSSRSFEGKERGQKSGKERGLVRCESARVFRRTPSSPSIILGMRKGVDCIGKKPLVTGDDDSDENPAATNNFIKSSIKSIKKVVKI